MNNLARCCELGRGVSKDLEKAVELYTKASLLGDENAMLNLGKCFMEGRGTTKDEQQAKKWFERAASLGNKLAKVLYDELKDIVEKK